MVGTRVGHVTCGLCVASFLQQERFGGFEIFKRVSTYIASAYGGLPQGSSSTIGLGRCFCFGVVVKGCTEIVMG